MARTKHGTLSADSVATVTITAPTVAIRVVNHGTTEPIYFTTDGTAPTVQGDDTWAVHSGSGRVVLCSDRDESVAVKLISHGTPDYSVEAAERLGEGYDHF